MSLREALALGESRWDALRTRAGSASPFTAWAWHDAWYASAAEDERNGAIVLAIFDRDGQLEAAIPLATRHVTHRRLGATALTWAVGDRGCPDHMEVLAAPTTPLDGLAEAIERMQWDMLQLDGIASDAVAAPRLRAALEGRGIVTVLRPQWPCPYIDLPTTWEEYLRSRPAKIRRNIGYRERSLFKQGPTSVSFYDGDDLELGWRHFRHLHDARWGGVGAFDDRLDALHRHFTASQSASGRLWLSTLNVAGEAVSAWYGFTDGDAVHCYQMGRSPEWNRFGVGRVHTGLMVQRAIAHGLRRFDFLRGDEPYKAEWATGTRWAQQMIAFRRSPKGRLLQLADHAGALRDQVAARLTPSDPDDPESSQ